MFKKFLAILLIVCLQCLSFAGLLADISFKLNKEYIAAKLCENRSKPKLSCLGKCYQKKMQKKAEEQKKVHENLLKDVTYLGSFEQSINFSCANNFNTSYLLLNNNGQSKGWPQKTFHPPGYHLIDYV